MGKGGKGKGKDREYGSERGSYMWVPESHMRSRSTKGKGKGDNANRNSPSGQARGRSRDRRVPTEYYYIKYPERARGLKVIKCVKPGCFGCCLLGENVPEKCHFCQTAFRVPTPSGSEKDLERPKQKPPARPSPKSRADLIYEDCLKKGMADADALEFMANTLKIADYKPKAARESDPKYATDMLAQLSEQISAIDEQIVAQQNKQVELIKQADAIWPVIANLETDKKRLQEERLKHNETLGGLVGVTQVAIQSAQRLGDDSCAQAHEFEAALRGVDLRAEEKDAIAAPFFGIITTAQLELAKQREQSQHERLQSISQMEVLSKRISELEQQISAKAAAPPVPPKATVPSKASLSSKSPMPLPPAKPVAKAAEPVTELAVPDTKAVTTSSSSSPPAVASAVAPITKSVAAPAPLASSASAEIVNSQEANESAAAAMGLTTDFDDDDLMSNKSKSNPVGPLDEASKQKRQKILESQQSRAAAPIKLHNMWQNLPPSQS